HGDDRMGYYHNRALEQISKLQMHGAPDRQGASLFHFYQLLLSLLRETPVLTVPEHAYYRLPLVSGPTSYTFVLGPIAEIGRCAQHGDYQRTISATNLDLVIKWCSPAQPINLWKALDLADGKPGNQADLYKQQPYDVVIYNPDKRPPSEIMVGPTGS